MSLQAFSNRKYAKERDELRWDLRRLIDAHNDAREFLSNATESEDAERKERSLQLYASALDSALDLWDKILGSNSRNRGL